MRNFDWLLSQFFFAQFIRGLSSGRKGSKSIDKVSLGRALLATDGSKARDKIQLKAVGTHYGTSVRRRVWSARREVVGTEGGWWTCEGGSPWMEISSGSWRA